MTRTWSGQLPGSASFNFADTSHPYHGTKNISVTSAASGNYGQFRSGTAVNLGNYNALGFYVQSKASWPKSKSLQVQWYSNWNAKQAAGSYITALTGDVTASGPGVRWQAW